MFSFSVRWFPVGPLACGSLRPPGWSHRRMQQAVQQRGDAGGVGKDYDSYCYLPMVGFVSFDQEAEQYLVTAVLRPGNGPRLGRSGGHPAPSDRAAEGSFSESQDPGAFGWRFCGAGSSGFFGLRAESGIPREFRVECGVGAQSGVGHEAGPSCFGELAANRACLRRVSVPNARDLAVETSRHL